MAHDFYSFKKYKMTDLERFSEQFLETEKEILVLMEKDTDGAMLFGQFIVFYCKYNKTIVI